MSTLQNLPYSLCEPGPAQVYGTGNFFLQIQAPAPSQRTLSTLYFLDSHSGIPSKTGNPDYEHIKQSQIDWFIKTSQEQRILRGSEQDNRLHLSLAFMHIPIPEYQDYHLNIYKGHRREPTECPSHNSNFYDALVGERISALGCGYDHVNDFCTLLRRPAQHDGDRSLQHTPWLCHAGVAGFRGYSSYDKKRFHRGARVWELDTTDGGLKTWRRVEYDTARIDELLLVKNGVVIDTGAGEDGSRHGII